MRRLLILLMVGLFIPRLLFSETSGSIQNFLPSTDGGPYFSVSGSQVLKPWHLDVGLTTNYAKQPLLVGTGTNERIIIDDLLFLDLSAAVGLLNWLEVGIGVPFAAWNDILVGTGRENNQGLGDVRFEPKLRIVDISDHDIGLSFVPFLPSRPETGITCWGTTASPVVDGSCLTARSWNRPSLPLMSVF